MSYYERTQRPTSARYSHPFDPMLEAFNKFNDAFYDLFDSMSSRYSDRLLDRPYYERQFLERPSSERQMLERQPYDLQRAYYDRLYNERLPERILDKGRERPLEKELERRRLLEKDLERGKISEKLPEGSFERGKLPEKVERIAPERSTVLRHEHPLVIGLLERPIMDVLGTFEDPFFKSNWESHSTFDRAHRLLEEMMNKGRPNINLSKEDELLKIPEEFEDVYREFGDKRGGLVTGTSYQTSNITRDGKTVTVVRESKLNPDGTISTKVSQHFDDGDGHRDTRSRKKKINYKTGVTSEKIGEDSPKKEKIEAQKEPQKTIEQPKKDEKFVEQPKKDEKITKESKEGPVTIEKEPVQQEVKAK